MKATPQALEVGVLNMPMNNTTDDIVALADKSTTAAAGTYLLIDAEYMTVTDASDPNNLRVTRGTAGTVTSHAASSEVSIGEDLPAPFLTENQDLLLQLAASIYTKTTINTLDDAYQYAKNLIAIMLADPAIQPPD